jgi:hypothetical protein
MKASPCACLELLPQSRLHLHPFLFATSFGYCFGTRRVHMQEMQASCLPKEVLAIPTSTEHIRISPRVLSRGYRAIGFCRFDALLLIYGTRRSSRIYALANSASGKTRALKLCVRHSNMASQDGLFGRALLCHSILKFSHSTLPRSASPSGWNHIQAPDLFALVEQLDHACTQLRIVHGTNDLVGCLLTIKMSLSSAHKNIRRSFHSLPSFKRPKSCTKGSLISHPTICPSLA